MRFWRFVFSFLYVRNWHTGHRELSRERLSLLAAGLFLIFFALSVIAYLQAPIEYAAGTGL